MQLSNVRAIVTGAASGLGRHFTLELAKAGAAVAAGDIDVKGLHQLKSESEDLPGIIAVTRLDISQEGSVLEFVREAFRQTGGINVLVNNAGIIRDGLLVKDEISWIKTLPRTQWRQVIDVNLTGSYLMARETVAEILRHKIQDSVVVNISSISRLGNSGQSNYAASKAGLDACTRTWALELAPHGVRVGGVAPGLIDTPMLRYISEEAKSALITRTPLQRIGTPNEVWLALKFIIECDFFTGRVIEVDGGATF
jgi:3-oxoacyl-[acyl-carrier protein] reductase